MANGKRRQVSRIVKLGISMGFFAASYIWDLILRMLGKKDTSRCVVLYYHAVTEAQRRRFAQQMDMFVRLARPFGLDSPPQIDIGGRHAAVTFDDGFLNVVDHALPELEKRNIPSTIFVTVGALGKLPDWWTDTLAYERHERIMSSDQLKQLPSELVAIGSHTLTHPMLPHLKEADARRELSESRTQLEGLLGREIKLFSFPFGAFNSELVGWCRGAGYERVFTSLPYLAFRNPEEFATGRIGVEPTDWVLEFYLKLMGAYRWLPLAIRVKRRLLSNPILKGPGKLRTREKERTDDSELARRSV